MSKLTEIINNDLKQAMRDKRIEVVSTLRMLVAALHNKEITLRQAGKAELTDEQAVAVAAGEIKKRQDSIEAFEQGGRQDLADKESGEIKILEKYLPAQLSDEELEKIVKEVIASGADNFGKVMSQVMARVKGKAQGGRVGELVKKMLGE